MNHYKVVLHIIRKSNDFRAIEEVQASNIVEAINLARQQALNEHLSWKAKILKAELIENKITKEN